MRAFVLGFIFPFLAAAAHAQPPTPGTKQAATDQAAPEYEDAIEVIGVTPIHGLGIAIHLVPGNVQSATAGDVLRRPASLLSDVLVANIGSVHANETQTNPFQPDIQFRGFTVSPLLGLPQGLAIYQDGVRMNEPFGDTVNWELLPTTAIASINVLPGSNPLFGLNALGGALSIQTKTGFTHPGHTARAFGGSFGRGWAEFESGAQRGALSYFATGRFLSENGWRDHSPSRMAQVFGNVSWRRDRTTARASITAGSNRLIGNGPAPVDLLEEDRRAVFTHPDETKTSIGVLTFNVRRVVNGRLSLDAVGFFRPARVKTFNGDDSPYEECEDNDLEGLLCAAGDDDAILDQFGAPIAADDELDATNNTSVTGNRGFGGGIQASLTAPMIGRANHFVAGFSFDGGRSRYEADTELAQLTEDRGTVGSGLLDSSAEVRLRTTSRHTGVYAADFLSVTPKFTVMGAARFTHSAIALRDQLGDELTGDHRFTRLNGAGGFTFSVTPRISTFGSFSTSSRVPTPSELSCADPDDPCRLPNAFVSDPPLQQVVAQTWEGGIRRTRGRAIWSAAAFRTVNHDDIVFVSSGALTNEGHFENVGDTLRRGLELSAAGSILPWAHVSGSYTYLDATFRTPLTLSSPNHPDEEDGEIHVRAGSTLPSTPRHHLKAAVALIAGPALLGGSVRYTSSQYFRGDEANLLEPIDGAAVVDANIRYAVNRRVALVGQFANVFGTEYASFGLFGEADEVLGDDYQNPRFLSPGAPRAAWIGVEVTLP
jgi:outer membrane receptor protein involved in Fe transport